MKRSGEVIDRMMDFMKKLNPFKRIHRQSEQSQQPPNARQHQQQLHSSDSKRKAADKELQHLNQKIEKILANLDENETGMEFSREEECVVCLSSKATMKTYPCGHCVVCRLCFVKTIQSAVSERRLPLKCVVCRTKILKLKQQQQQQQRSRPNFRSWTRNPSNHLISQLRGQPSAPNPRSTSSASAGVSSLTTRQIPPNRSSSVAAAGVGAHRPTATKLMQPLLIYPAARPGDLKRRPGAGWMSPPDAVSDAGTTPGPITAVGEMSTTTFRLRTKNVPGGTATSAAGSSTTEGAGIAGSGGGSGGGGGGGGGFGAI